MPKPKRPPVDDLVDVPLNWREAYSVSEVAALLGVHRTTLYPHIQSGRLKSYRLGTRRRLISRQALAEFQAQMTEECSA